MTTRRTGQVRRVPWAIVARMLTWIDRSIPAVSVLLVILVFPTYRVFELETSVHDLLQKSRYLLGSGSATSVPSIAIVEIDDEAIRLDPERRLTRSETTSRSYLAEVVRRVTAAGPRVLALDYVLDEPSDPEEDRQLRDALRAALRSNVAVVLASRLIPTNRGRTAVLPLPAFLEPAWQARPRVGYANVETYRTDGVVREVVPAKRVTAPGSWVNGGGPGEASSLYGVKGETYSLSFPLQVLLAQLHAENGDTTAAIERLISRGRLFMDYSTWDDGSFVLSSAALGTESADLSLAHGIVMVGDGDSQSTDRHQTPLSTPTTALPGLVLVDALHPDPSGAQVHALAYRTLAAAARGGPAIRVLNQWVLTGSVVLLLASVWLALAATGHRSRFPLVAAGTLVLYVTLAVTLFIAWLVYLPVVRPGAAILMGMISHRAVEQAKRPEPEDPNGTDPPDAPT